MIDIPVLCLEFLAGAAFGALGLSCHVKRIEARHRAERKRALAVAKRDAAEKARATEAFLAPYRRLVDVNGATDRRVH